MDRNLSKLSKSRYQNKNTFLQWFLLIIHKKHTKQNIFKPFNRNHFTLYFWLRREGRQMPNTKQLPYQTDKSSHRRYSFKKALLKNFAMFMGKLPMLVSLFDKTTGSQDFKFIKKRLQHRFLPVSKLLWNPYFEEYLRKTTSEPTLRSGCLELCLWTFAFKTIQVAFKPEL